MAKKTISEEKAKTAARIKRTEAYAEKVRLMFAQTVNNILALNKSIPTLEEGVMFSFDGESMRMQKKVEEALRQLHSAATLAIRRGISLEWEIANEEADKLIKSAFGKRVLESPEFNAWLDRNDAARDAFLNRSDKGLNLSDRIWKSVRQLRDEMEVAITVSIGEGDSASSMSRKVREYLNDPDLMFRRFRYKKGEKDIIDPETGKVIGKEPVYGLKWKKRVRDEQTGKTKFIDYDRDSYKTGAGVYKSSAKNAMRVARTETNIAYRHADHERWQGMDFVLGQHIELSRSHPKKDICDKLAGDYPKDFMFEGWHPQCFCVCTPILMDASEMAKMSEAFLKGETYTPKGKQITDYPAAFKDWVREHADDIANARERGSEPYFIRNNAQAIDEIINPTEKKLTPLEIAEKRHAARTPEQEDEIRRRAAYRAKTIRAAETLLSDFEGMDGVDTSALRDAIKHARWDDARSEALILAQKKRSIIEKGISIKSELGGIKDVDLKKLQKAMASGKLSEIKIHSDALGKIKDEIEALSLLDDPMKVARETSFATAKVVQKAVERTMSGMPADLESRKSKLEFEIRWIEKEGAKRYPDTWKYSQDAYKKELAFVQKKIDVKSVMDSVADAIAYSVSSRSKDFRLLADEMRAILSSPDIDIAVAKAKAQQLNDKYNTLKTKGQKKAKTYQSKSIKHETIADLQKRLGSDMPKTLPNLEKAIAAYEKCSLYGTKAKQHKAEIEELMRRLFDEHDLGMNIDDDTLEAVLNSWFKNTFETGSSGGYTGSTKTTGKISSSHNRLGAAHRLFGLGKDLDADQLARHDYEKYGNLLDHNIVESMAHNTARQYGNVEVRFKKDKVIATWTAGDSLGEQYQPSLVSDPRSCSFDDMSRTPTSASIQTSDLAQFKRDHISSYLELQYHGDLTVDCVESLTFPYDLKDPSRSRYLSVAQKWKARGVKIYYIVNGTLYQL